MGLYKYKKWFFDFETNDNTYYLLFVSVIEIGHKKLAYIQAHSEEDPNGKRLYIEDKLHLLDTSHNNLNFKEGQIYFKDNEVDINLTHPNFGIRLSYKNQSNWQGMQPGFLMHGKRNTMLTWRPKYLNNIVFGEIQFNKKSFLVHECKGYIDEVVSNISPFKIRICKLYWGRLVNDDISLSYSLIYNKNDQLLEAKLYVSVKEEWLSFKSVTLKIHKTETEPSLRLQYAEHYTLKSKNDNASISIDISNHNTAVVNDFMNYEKKYGKIITRALRKITGNPAGVKSHASCNVNLDINGTSYNFKNLQLIDEYVHFRD